MRSKRLWFFGVSFALVAAVIVMAHEVMLPFVLATVIAYVLTPAVSWVERRTKRRGVAIVLVYALVLGVIGIFLRLVAPRVGEELGNLRRELPKQAALAKEQWIPPAEERLKAAGLLQAPPPDPSADQPAVVVHPQPDGSYAIDVGSGFLLEPRNDGFVIAPREPPAKIELSKLVDEATHKSVVYVQSNAVELVKFGGNLVASAARAVFVFGITLMLAAYMMLTREKIVGFMSSLLVPSNRESFSSLLARIDKGLSGVVRGQLVICLINGVLSAIGFALVGLKYWPVLALIATVLSLIPIFGSIISAIPAVALGLTQSLGTAVFVLAWIVGIHQLEANFLNPKIMGDAAKIHPVLVIFSLIVGEHFFHAVGALLAVPCMSIAQSLFLHLKEVWRVGEEEPSRTA
jgi:predicted PurR-regulated permease PerM